jgi:hypothetical protein
MAAAERGCCVQRGFAESPNLLLIDALRSPWGVHGTDSLC